MAGVLGTVATGLGINIATSLAYDKKIERNDKKAIEQIRLHISEFNRRYENTEVDAYAFQMFFRDSDVVDKIYARVFETYLVESESIIDFKERIAKYAIDKINKHYEKYSRQIKNEDIFYEYFCDLVDSLISIRGSLLTLKSSVQTAIITEHINNIKKDIKDEIDITRHQVKEEIKAQFEQMKEDNLFAEDKINEIKDLVSLFRYSEAEKEISDVLEAQQFLSNSQKEIVFYQRARIFINMKKYSELDNILMKIRRINSESKYIAEVNYHIACHKKDIKLFDESITLFEENKYSSEQLLLKRAYFEMVLDNMDKVFEMIALEGEIKEELQEFSEAHFYFGNALIRTGDFEKGYKEFVKAFDLYKNIAYRYNSLISKYYILFNDTENMISGSKDFLDDVINTIDEFKDLRYIIEYFSDEDAASYWMFVINLTSIVDPKQSLVEIAKIDKRLDNNKLIKSIKADVYFKNYMDKEAKEILEELWDFIPINTINLFAIYAKEENWNNIISMNEQIKEMECKEHPGVKALYFKAKNEIEGYDSVRDDILRSFEIYSNEIAFIRDSIKIVLENQDEETLSKMLTLIALKKDSMYDYELKLIGQLLNKYSKFEESRNLLEERIEKNEYLLNIYIQSFEELDELSDLVRIANEKTKTLYNNGCRYKNLLKFKAHIEMVLMIPRKVIQTLEEYRSIYGIDDFYAYNYVVSKIEKKEYEGLDSEVDFLLNTDDAFFHQLVAILRAKQGFWDEAQRIALSALYLSHDNIRKEILMNYISMHYSNIDKEQKYVNLEEIIKNSIVTLKSKDRVRNIAIHNNKSIIVESGEFKFGCENYHSDDAISLILMSMGKKGAIVTLGDDEYEVVNIVYLYAYFYNFCFSKLQTDYPEHNFFITSSHTTQEKIIEDMKKTMEMVNEDKNKELHMYNFGIESGLPVSYLSGKNIESYSEMIISLLNHKNQHFYAGEISVYQYKEYVLSLSSIITLATFGLLDKLEHIAEKCIVTTEVEKSIREGMKESQKHAKITSGVVLLNDDGELNSYIYNEEDKKNRKAFWTNIMLKISKINKEEVKIDDNDMYEIFAMYLLDEDVSSIELSKKSSKILVCDDLFIRKLHHGVTGTFDTTNTIGFIVSEGLASFEELIDLTLKLVKCKYLYPLNTSLMYEFFIWILSIQDDNKRKLYFEKLKEIYKTLLDDTSAPYYTKMHEEFVRVVQVNGLPISLVYELVREPFKLKPFDEFLHEKSHEIIKNMFYIDKT